MIGYAKIVGLSAILAAGLVTAFEAPQATVSEKRFTDRLPQAEAAAAGPAMVAYAVQPAAMPAAGARKGDALRDRLEDACGGQTWPYIARECLSGAPAAKARVRTITIEQRPGDNVSVLVRLPATKVAAR